MKITYKGEYGIKAMLDLSYRYNGTEIVPLTDIAMRQDIPVKYLEQIMLVLKKAGYVESKRGIGGGFILSKPPDSITLGEIVRAIEGPLEPVTDNKTDNSNYQESAIREVWQQVKNATEEIVDTVTFAGIMRRADELRQQNNELIYYI